MNLFDNRAFVNQFVAGLLVMIGFGGTVGLGTVWMRHQVSVLAERNSAIETQIKEVERRIASTSALVEAARSQDVLVDKNESMHLGLQEMTLAQVFAVRDDPIPALVARSNERVFASERAAAITPTIHIDLAQPVAPALAAAAAHNGAALVPSTRPPAAGVAPRHGKQQFAFTE